MDNYSWVNDPDFILHRLESPRTQVEQEEGVIFAEILPIPEHLLPRFMTALKAFIVKNIYTADDETMTALGSAIRKYAMNLPETSFNDYASFFDVVDTTIHPQMELELVKSIHYRMLYEPFDVTVGRDILNYCLYSLAEGYMFRQLILRDFYVNIVLHATEALVLSCDHSDLNFLIGRLNRLNIQWITDLFYRHLKTQLDIHDLTTVLRERIKRRLTFS